MKVIEISDELYEKLKNSVVDPFDDTPESVISRLIDIVDKAKSRWSPLDAYMENTEQQGESQNRQPRQSEPKKDERVVVL